MKKIFKNLSILSFFLLALSCSDADKEVDGVFEGTTSGGLLRTIEINGTVVQTGVVFNSAPVVLGEEETSFTLVLEAQDNNNGGLLERIDVALAYVNNSDGPVASTDELFWQSFNSSEFSTGPNGLPRISFATTFEEVRTFLQIDEDEYNGGDQFLVVFTYVMTDGRTFTYTNSNSNVVGGVYMRSPFKYTLNIVCPITESLAGTHSYVTTSMFRPGVNPCGGTVSGTVTWSSTDEDGDPLAAGLYRTSDLSFGMFESSCWFDSPAVSDGSRVKWFCDNIVSEGNDQYGSSWAYTTVSVNGPTMVISFISDYQTGEGGTTTITREGGQDWPAIFQD